MTGLVQVTIVATHEYYLSNGNEKPHSVHYKYRHKGVVFDYNYLGSIQESCSYLYSTVVLPNITGVRVSEPHTSELNGRIYIVCMSSVRVCAPHTDTMHVI